ncbi:MAG: TolC family protein, partial [Muribaculaceae bacterium]|nr:TolC family protein [Muribaculaceae bacterium]
MKTHISVSTVFVTAALLGGMMVVAAHEGIDGSVPDSWMYMSDLETTSVPDDDSWWKEFDDPVLDSLIRMGIDNNYNLDMAARRIEIAGNNVGIARSGYFPVMALGAGWPRSRTSGMTGNEPGEAATGSYWNLGLNMSWEIDLFGKIKS